MGLQNKCTQNTSLKASDVDYFTEQDIFREKMAVSQTWPVIVHHAHISRWLWIHSTHHHIRDFIIFHIQYRVLNCPRITSFLINKKSTILLSIHNTQNCLLTFTHHRDIQHIKSKRSTINYCTLIPLSKRFLSFWIHFLPVW